MIQKEIELKPISVNTCWQGRRFRTKDYKQFEKDFLTLIGKADKMTGQLEVVIEFYVKNKRFDIDNGIKPVLDCLVKAGYMRDDSDIFRLDIYKYISKKERINIVINKI